MNSRLELVTNSTQQLEATQKALFSISQNTRQEFGATADLYTKLTNATKELGLSQTELLRFTESLNKTFIIAGTGAQETASTIRQLGQAMSSGVLRGDEFNSIMENNPRFAEAMRDGLNKTNGELRAMAEQGQLTSKIVTDAFKSQADAIDEEFGRIPETVAQSVTVIENALQSAIGEFDEATGATEALGVAMKTAFFGVSTVVVELTNAFDSLGARIAGVAFRLENGVFLNDAQSASLERMYDETKKNIAARDQFLVTLEKGLGFQQKSREELDAEAAAVEGAAVNTYEYKQSKEELAAVNAQLAAEAPFLQSAVEQESAAVEKNTEEINRNTAAKNQNSAATTVSTQLTAEAASWNGQYTATLPTEQERLAWAKETLYNNQGFFAGSFVREQAKNIIADNNQKGVQEAWENSLKSRREENSLFEQTNSTLNSFDKALDKAVFNIGLYNDALGDLQTISNILGADISGRASSALFGSSVPNITYEQSRIAAQAAFDAFKLDPTNVELAQNYDKSINLLIDTLDEFNDTTKFVSKRDQEYAKFLALRQAQQFEEIALEEQENTDASIALLTDIKNAVDGTQTDSAALQNKDALYAILTNGGLTLAEKTDQANAILGNVDSGTTATASNTVDNLSQGSLSGKIRVADTDIHRNLISGEINGETTTYAYYKNGGYTGNMSVNAEAGIVHGQEYVLNAQTTADLGLNGSGGVFQQMNNKLDMLANLYEINKTTKKQLRVETNTNQVLVETQEAV